MSRPPWSYQVLHWPLQWVVSLLNIGGDKSSDLNSSTVSDTDNNESEIEGAEASRNTFFVETFFISNLDLTLS